MQKLICDIPKNARETLRVELSEFKGHNLVALRLYVPASDGDGLKPTAKGITFKVGLLPEILEALAQAETEARSAGLLKS